jgi:hypothetical protein
MAGFQLTLHGRFWVTPEAEGSGSGDYRIHEINRSLGELRSTVISIAKQFEIPWHLLEK